MGEALLYRGTSYSPLRAPYSRYIYTQQCLSECYTHPTDMSEQRTERGSEVTATQNEWEERDVWHRATIHTERWEMISNFNHQMIKRRPHWRQTWAHLSSWWFQLGEKKGKKVRVIVHPQKKKKDEIRNYIFKNKFDFTNFFWNYFHNFPPIFSSNVNCLLERFWDILGSCRIE